MRGDVHLMQCFDELLCVIAIVRTKREGGGPIARCLASLVDHGLGRFAFGMVAGGGNHRAGHQGVTVVTEGVPHEAQVAGGVVLAAQPGIAFGGGGMFAVAMRLALDVGPVIVAAVTVL